MATDATATANNPTQPRTMSVPEAGAIYFGLGRQAAYAAVARNDIPVIRLGRRLRVPIAALERRFAAVE